MLDERARMAREIHDTIAQGLTGIVTQLEAAEQAQRSAGRLATGTSTTPMRLARESLAEARRSVEASMPGGARGRDAAGRARRRRARWSAINGVPVEFTITGDGSPLHPEIEVALLRTAQEALANVAKHAGASRAGLTLSYMGDVVTLDVRDDGVGFAVGRAGRPGPAPGSG